MSNINQIITEALFRARSVQMKLRPAVLAYKLVYNHLPLKLNSIANKNRTNKLYDNGNLHDSHLEREWLMRLYNSPHVPDNFEISGGFDTDNLAYISFKTEITPRLRKILDKIKSFNDTYVEVDKKTFGEPLVLITTNNWYDNSPLNKKWSEWFDSVTSALEDNSSYD